MPQSVVSIARSEIWRLPDAPLGVQKRSDWDQIGILPMLYDEGYISGPKTLR
jgi:hypothetical protein